MISLINFTECSDDLKKLIHQWRNNPDITRYSINKKEISLKEHFEFIDRLKNDKSKKYFLVQDDETLLGVINFTNINKESAVSGYYKNPFLDRKGIADILFNEIKKYAENTLHIKEIIMYVFKENKISIHCIEKNGYKYISEMKNIIKYKLDLYENR